MGITIRGSFNLPSGRVWIGNADSLVFQGDIELSTSLMPEGRSRGFLVGYLGIASGREGQTYTYFLDEDAGGRFQVNGARLEVGPVRSDYSLARSHTIRIRALDSAGRETAKTITIDVSSLASPTTWNPADKNAEAIVTGGNLVLSASVNGLPGGHVRSMASITRGKWYFEVSTTGNDGALGLSTANAVFTPYFTDPRTIVMDSYNGWVMNNGTLGAVAPWRGGVGMLAYDADAGKVWFGANGDWGSGNNPVTRTGGFTFAPGVPVHAYGYVYRQINMTARFGATSFMYPVPDGYHPGIFHI